MEGRLKKTERLIKIWSMIHNNPQGYTVKELVDRFDVNARTIYRDLLVLQNDLKVPLYDENKRWKLDMKQALPPLRFTIPEALNVFLAVRLMASYNSRYDPNLDATFSKLGSILPAPLAEQVQKTMDWMQTLTKDDHYLNVLSELANAWVNLRRVRIKYRAFNADEELERTIEPYFIEPAATGHASYVVAYCHRAGEIRNFRINRINRINTTTETYTIPPEFSANRYFSPAWGVSVEGESRPVKLKFNSSVSRLIEETIWHPSQALKKLKDGSVLMMLNVMDTIEFSRWILWWGKDVEVIEPEALRNTIQSIILDMGEIYTK